VKKLVFILLNVCINPSQNIDEMPISPSYSYSGLEEHRRGNHTENYCPGLWPFLKLHFINGL